MLSGNGHLVKTPKAPVCFSIPPQVTDQLEWKVQSESPAGVSCHAYHQGKLVDLHSLVMNQSSGRRC